MNATSGSTVMGAFDPLDELAAVCKKHALWLHVDACWGGSFIMSGQHKKHMEVRICFQTNIWYIALYCVHSVRAVSWQTPSLGILIK